MEIPLPGSNKLRQVFSGRQGRDLREYITAYLMISPAMILIFIFGLFPVGFALYVSVYKWLIIQGDFRGITNYFKAIDNLTFIIMFAIAIGSLMLAYRKFQQNAKQASDHAERPWLLLLPAALHAATIYAFLRWVYLQLPEFLDIARKMRGLERTRELFVRLLSEAFFAESVIPAWQLFTSFLLAAIISALLAGVFWRNSRNANYQWGFTIFWLAAALGVSLLSITYLEIQKMYADAVVTGEDPGIWPQLIMVSSGVILLILAWKLWKSSENQDSTRGFIFRILASTALMVGAVLMIIEIPTIVASGDPDLWQGLRVTIFFSLGTVPIQLTLAIFLSVLLFQKLKGSELFRIIFFLPYITPGVASAALFRQIFSDRQTSPANKLVTSVGIEPQKWTREPDGIISMVTEAIGISDFPNSWIPAWFSENLTALLSDWLTGPSLALLVIILLSIWTFIGYNVVIYLAGLGNIPKELTEAAEIDGANKWDVFRHITFPLLSPTTYFLSLIAVIGTFKAFNTIWVMRQVSGAAAGSIMTFSVVIFEEFFVKTRYGYAAALAFVLFAVILSLTFINNKIQGARVFYG